MTKRFIFTILLLCSLSCSIVCAASGAQFFLSGEDTLRWYTNTNETASSSILTFSAEIEQVSASVSCHYDADRLGVTLQDFYALPVTSGLSIGPDASLHYVRRLGLYQDLDLLGGIRTVWQPSTKTRLDLGVWYMLKASRIDAIQSALPWLTSNTFAISLDVRQMLSQKWTLGFKASSFNSTQYPVFMAPFFTLYTGYAFTNDITAYFGAEAHYIDFFTLSSNLNALQAKACICWRLP